MASVETTLIDLTEPTQKRRWFAEGEGCRIGAWDLTFCIGGLERSRFRFQDGPAINHEMMDTNMRGPSSPAR